MPRRRAAPSTIVVEAKPWQESRSIWLAVLSVVVPIVTYVADNALALGLPDKAIPWIALFIFAAGSIRQRFETTQPIGKSGEMVPVDGLPMSRTNPRKLTSDEILEIAEYLRNLGLRDVDPEDPERISAQDLAPRHAEPEGPPFLFTEQEAPGASRG